MVYVLTHWTRRGFQSQDVNVLFLPTSEVIARESRSHGLASRQRAGLFIAAQVSFLLTALHPLWMLLNQLGSKTGITPTAPAEGPAGVLMPILPKPPCSHQPEFEGTPPVPPPGGPRTGSTVTITLSYPDLGTGYRTGLLPSLSVFTGHPLPTCHSPQPPASSGTLASLPQAPAPACALDHGLFIAAKCPGSWEA